jgi:hypothetical protein
MLSSSVFSFAAITAVLSAKVAILVFSVWGTSYVYDYNRYRTGPNTLPCGTPAFISLRLEYLLLVLFWIACLKCGTLIFDDIAWIAACVTLSSILYAKRYQRLVLHQGKCCAYFLFF